MKIDKKEYQKLKQLDKIEYYIRKSRIEDDKPSPTSGIYSWLFGVGVIFLLMTIIGFQIESEKMLIAAAKILNIGIWSSALFLIINYVSIFYNNKKLKELNEEFFSSSIKPKRK